jgi:hypothetical protein
LEVKKDMNAINILLGAFMALMVLGGMATAANTAANTVINANVLASVEVTAPNSIDLGGLNVGQNSLPLGQVTVGSNAANWRLWCSGNGYFNGFSTYNFLSVPTVDNKYYGSNAQDGTPVQATGGVLATGVAAGTFSIPVQLSVNVPVTAPIGATTTTETFTAGLY